MIEVKINLSNQRIQKIKISGHALYAPHGEDLVCAGVSSIGTGLLNALDILVPSSCKLILRDYISIQVVEDSEVVQTILRTGVIQLETIAEQYGDYLKVIKQEV